MKIFNTFLELVLMTVSLLMAPLPSSQAHEVPPPQGPTTIQVDGTTRYQTMMGFGASFKLFDSPVSRMDSPHGPTMVGATPEQRKGIEKILFTDLGLTRARFFPVGFEPQNDNADPNQINRTALNWKQFDQVTNLIAESKQYGLKTPWASFSMDQGESQEWLRKPHSCALDPAKIDEEVEWLFIAAQHFKEVGQELPYMAINNEPDLCPPGFKIEIGDMVTIIKKLGKRLRAAGISTKIVAIDGWIPQNVIKYLEAILSDPEARQYVGAVAYHAYADGYDNPVTMLHHSAASSPPAPAVEVRRQIRDLAERYKLPVWMTEICYCTPRAATFSEFDLLRARLNHLHDELTLANASAFDVMNMYNILRPGVYDELVHVFYRPDGAMERYEASTYGKLIGQYARAIPPGSVRLKAESSDPRLRVLAFDRPDGKLAVVVLNNNPASLSTKITLAGLKKIPKGLKVFNSREGAIGKTLPDLPVNSQAVVAAFPGLSLTTFLGGDES